MFVVIKAFHETFFHASCKIIIKLKISDPKCVMPRNKKYFSRRNWGIYAHARRPQQSLKSESYIKQTIQKTIGGNKRNGSISSLILYTNITNSIISDKRLVLADFKGEQVFEKVNLYG